MRDLETNSLWTDDGRAMSWKLNSNTYPGWHTIKYLNTTNNGTYDRLNKLPYYFHHPLVSNQESWQRSFFIDSDVYYDYTQIELDIYTFCGWNHKKDSIYISLAFEEYLQFVPFWESTHASRICEGEWKEVIDIIRLNNATQSDISCYTEGLEAPLYECTLEMSIRELQQKENVPASIYCEILDEEGEFSLYYSQNDGEFNEIIQDNFTIVDGISRSSKLRIDVETYNESLSGLKCEIFVNNETAYYSNVDPQYWSITESSTNNTRVVSIDDGDQDDITYSTWIWMQENTSNISNYSFVSFQFDFYYVFITEYELSYINTGLNVSNQTNITHILFSAAALTSCQLTFHVNDSNVTSVALSDNQYITSYDKESELMQFINNPDINQITVELHDFVYNCRLDLFTGCNFDGNITRIDGKFNDSVNILSNASSWILYSDHGYECFAIFSKTDGNITYTMEAEDGGLLSEPCNALVEFDNVELKTLTAHYGCYTHVRFQAPHTISQPFVIRIDAEIDDMSTKFGTYSKSWGFGNLTITPLICSEFSNIVPIKSPIILNDEYTQKYLTIDELISLEHQYLLVLINKMALEIVLSNSANNNDTWRIVMTKNDCKLENLQLSETKSCTKNTFYADITDTIATTDQELIWINWNPNNVEIEERKFSFGTGSKLNHQTIASLNIYADESGNMNYNIDYVKFIRSTTDKLTTITIAPIQIGTPKICLSQLGELNKFDLGNVWVDDCDENGWEVRKQVQIYNDIAHFYGIRQNVYESIITELNTDSITKLTSDCFHGPFGGSDSNNLTNFGDYVSRFFYVFADAEPDIIKIDLEYYSLCTWNAEQYENDTAYLFVDHNAIWRSAPQYEFVTEYCQGFSLYSDWELYLEYNEILNSELIECLNLLDQKCSYPVSITFPHHGENALYFSLGIAAKLNQYINNEAFGFSKVSISYHDCPKVTSFPIGNIIKQPFDRLTDYVFQAGDMLVISSNSLYYLVAEYSDKSYYINNGNQNCTFILYGGYKMWSMESSNCTISALEIMKDISANTYDEMLEIGIANDGVLSMQEKFAEDTVWSRRTPCDSNTAYYYYSMNKTNSLRFYDNVVDNSIYSTDCKWAMIISRDGPIKVFKNINETSGDGGESVWSNGTKVKKLLFDESGSLILYHLSNYDDIETNYTLSSEGADFMIFDGGKLALFDYENNELVKQFDFEFAECQLNEDIGFIKYFHFMKPNDILWNGEVLISANCQYKLMLSKGDLMILNGSNHKIWQQQFNEKGGEKLAFLKDGNMIVYSYSNDNEILWSSNTSTLLDRDNIYYPNRAIISNNGEFILTDNITFNVYFDSSNEYIFGTQIIEEYNKHMDCDNSKYEFVD
eukprot:144327_1